MSAALRLAVKITAYLSADPLFQRKGIEGGVTENNYQREDTMATFNPTAEEAAKAKAFINFLMQDRFFLALYRSNDPKIRAAAMDKLDKAHHLAYGDPSTKGDDARRME